MKFIELQEAFERELNQFTDDLHKPASDDTEYWINAGLDKFVKTRYSGINYKREGFEQSQKRIDDLRTLVTRHTYADADTNRIDVVDFPEDYLITLGETAKILPTRADMPCWPKDAQGNYIPHSTDVIEATVENIDRKLENSLSEHHLHNAKARPLRLIQGNTVEFFTDGNYYVNEYTLTYLRKPAKIILTATPFEQYIDMPEHTHIEIIKLAAQLYLENQGNPRYSSYSNEVNLME